MNRRQSHRPAAGHRHRRVPRHDCEPRISAPALRAVLIVAADPASIHAARWRLDGPASEEAIRKALYVSTVPACWKVEGRPCMRVRETCRSRFEIDSSCRPMDRACGRISTRGPELRLPRAGIALVLRRERARLHFAGFSTPRRDGRLIGSERLRPRELLRLPIQVIEEACGTIRETRMERQLCSELLDWRTKSRLLGTTETPDSPVNRRQGNRPPARLFLADSLSPRRRGEHSFGVKIETLRRWNPAELDAFIAGGRRPAKRPGAQR